MSISFPGETAEYRAARQALLSEEIALRQHVEKVAAQRRQMPLGGMVPTDYVFTALDGSHVPMSAMFTHPGGTLGIYSLMYRPD